MLHLTDLTTVEPSAASRMLQPKQNRHFVPLYSRRKYPIGVEAFKRLKFERKKKRKLNLPKHKHEVLTPQYKAGSTTAQLQHSRPPVPAEPERPSDSHEI